MKRYPLLYSAPTLVVFGFASLALGIIMGISAMSFYVISQHICL